MKTWFLILQWPLLISLFGHSCKHESSQATMAQPVQATVAQDTTQIISFEQEILPILKSHCSPCHFTGGKMYAKMPFDNPQTIKSHVEGVLKRFKDPELAKIKSYLESGATRQ
jgi:hypothetical protein